MVNVIEKDGRRIFYIDVNDMPTDKAIEYIAKIRKQFAK